MHEVRSLKGEIHEVRSADRRAPGAPHRGRTVARGQGRRDGCMRESLVYCRNMRPEPSAASNLG